MFWSTIYTQTYENPFFMHCLMNLSQDGSACSPGKCFCLSKHIGKSPRRDIFESVNAQRKFKPHVVSNKGEKFWIKWLHNITRNSVYETKINITIIVSMNSSLWRDKLYIRWTFVPLGYKFSSANNVLHVCNWCLLGKRSERN